MMHPGGRIAAYVASLAALLLAVGIPSPALASSPTTNVMVYVLRGHPYGLIGPDGKHHDTIIPSNFVLRAGVAVRLTFVNFDEGPHTMSIPGLGINIYIKPGTQLKNGEVSPTTTVFTFTPHKVGDFRWQCDIPCDKGGGYWAMSAGRDGPDQDGFMAGYVVVLPNSPGAM
jgi:hypothetical protein